MSEVKPKFAPRVQAVWNSCGTYIDSINPEVAEKELEFFITELIKTVIDDISNGEGPNEIDDLFKYNGYINE